MNRIASFWLALLIAFNVPAFSQMPVLKIDDKDDPSVYLSKLKVDVKVTGNVAITTMEMTFHNKNNRLLEGELVFPLPEGITVSRYALDMNGQLREAVPVEKIKATEVFETIERRRVDPGLLERTEGNNFRTRIYPIPANGSRTVLIGYEEELKFNNKHALRYHLPLDYKRPIDQFSLTINVLQSPVAPELEEDPDADLSFKEWNHNYTAVINKDNFTASKSLTVNLPKSPGNNEVLIQRVGANYYFLVNSFPQKETRPKPMPGAISIIWDVSLSGLSRNTKKELDLLTRYLHLSKKLLVHLYLLNNTFKKDGDYTIVDGNLTELEKKIGQLQYDGGTEYSKIAFNEGEEFLLFSDGLSSLGEAGNKLPAKPVYTISSSPSADFSYLQFLAQSTGGSFINLNELTIEEGGKLLAEQPLLFIGIKPSQELSETYPSIPTPIINSFSLAGICTQPHSRVTLLFGYGTTVTTEKTIELTYEKNEDGQINLQHTWAQKKIAELDIQFERNKELITQLGKQFSIVTRNTSLIVLESVEDYVRYEIEPPKELRDQYDRLIKEHWASLQNQRHVSMNNALQQMDVLMNWWDVSFKPVSVAVNPVHNSDTAIVQNNIRVGPGTISGRVTDNHGMPLSGATVNVKGTRVMVVTNDNGNFTLNSPAFKGRKLVFNYIGYETKQVSMGNNNEVNVKMKPMEQYLNEVVVVGYGTERRSDVTASVSSVAADQLETTTSRPARREKRAEERDRASASNMLAGSTSGVVIRGAASVVQGNDASSAGDLIKRIPGVQVDANGNVLARGEREDDKQHASVDIKNWTPDREYLRAIAKGKPSSYFEIYLNLRKDYLSTPTFYYDMANFFFQQQDTATGLQVLTNMAEIDVQNHELYKLLGFKLRETGHYDMALYIFKKVLEWRPQEPQSYRDYGLALADAGYYQQALDTFNTAIAKNYNESTAGLYPGFEEIIVTEMNQLIALHKNKLNLANTDAKLIHPMPVDIRVVLNWNKTNTDMDLWVTDPNNEKCYYSHKNTLIGGRLSNDFTRGYGPEQFMLKKAMAGKYLVQVNYYGDTQVTISGPTTVMAEIFLHYSNGNQERKMITLQMEKSGRQDGVLVGEFDFGK